MLYVTDNFTVSMVSIDDVANLRFEELSEKQVKIMTRGLTDVTVGISDRKLLGVYNSLSATLNRPRCLEGVVVCETDVVILLRGPMYVGASTGQKFFRVTCRKDFEIFDINGISVLLDRDGEVHGRAESFAGLPELMTKRDALNGES